MRLFAIAWTVAHQAPLSGAIIYRLTAFPENLQKSFKEKDHTRHQDTVGSSWRSPEANEWGSQWMMYGCLPGSGPFGFQIWRSGPTTHHCSPGQAEWETTCALIKMLPSHVLDLWVRSGFRAPRCFSVWWVCRQGDLLLKTTGWQGPLIFYVPKPL